MGTTHYRHGSQLNAKADTALGAREGKGLNQIAVQTKLEAQIISKEGK
jgi:hypothetical protein